MYHTAGAKLEPAAVLAGGASLAAADKAVYVKLKSGLHKREKSRTQADLYIALKYLRKHGLHEEYKV